MIDGQPTMVLGAAIFSVGLAGLLMRRSWLAALVCLGVMNLGLVCSAVAAASRHDNGVGAGVALICILLSSALGAVGLAAALGVISARRSEDSDRAATLRW